MGQIIDVEIIEKPTPLSEERIQHILDEIQQRNKKDQFWMLLAGVGIGLICGSAPYALAEYLKNTR